MRIALQTWGSEGDARPFLALAAGLAAAGHRVCVALTDPTGRDYLNLAAPLGIEVRMVAEPGPAEIARLDALGGRLLAASVYRQGRLLMDELFTPVLAPLQAAARELCEDADLVIGHFFLHPLHIVAEAAGVPAVSITLAPDMVPSAAHAPSGLPSRGPLWNRACWSLASRVLDRGYLAPVNRARRAAGLAPARHFLDTLRGGWLDLVAVSPVLCPPPPDWPASRRCVGPLLLPATPPETPSSDPVAAFLAAGEAPVFVGFGSLTPRDEMARAELLAVVEGALARAGARALVQGLAPPGITAGGRILHVARVAHAQVFPRCAVLVHHGGAGTSHAAARAGVPSVVVPHVVDQFFWARCLWRHGVAAAPLARRRLSVARLHQALTEAARPALAQRAALLATAMRGEDGVAGAIAAIDARLTAGSP